ncbi:PiggyBac transposable element-derived protein 5 [Dissostichus eleginoides]|uniref:PiggyBac transposable element-derived protein 5 n=1 Tax=Dissostichus eleginoides TaxID=100907 RepID=A0AAD9FAQ8_DISEL|nr:PiggyBac transposable element-derived protein 5 [Dissostichus eleginoides]
MKQVMKRVMKRVMERVMERVMKRVMERVMKHVMKQVMKHVMEHVMEQFKVTHVSSSSALTEPDLQFAQTEARLSAEAPLQNQDLMDPSWRSADCWKPPSDSQSSIASFSQCSGPHHFLSKTSDAVDYFLLMFPPALLDLITFETNAHIKTCHFLGCGLPDWVPVTTLEIKGFLGLVVLMGLQNLPDPAQFWSWSHYDNSYAFCRAMSFRRFQQISSSIRMGSFTTDRYRGTRTTKDALHIFRPMLDLLGGAMWTRTGPTAACRWTGPCCPAWGGQPRQGGPEDPAPGVLLCDSKSGFCHRLFIQVGAQGGPEPGGPEPGGPEPGFTVVPELVKGLEGRHHQLFLSSSLASVPLLQKLLDQGLYASCSFPPPSPILPPALWAQGLLERPGDFLQRQLGPVLATRWRDTKEMCCLSTNAAPGQQDLVFRRSQTRGGELEPITRPGAFRLLQENLRGVDICKQLLACNPLGGVPQDRHWRGLLWFLVNLSIVNAFLLLRESAGTAPPPG